VEYRRAGLGDLDLLAPLFDAYRQFYERPSDPKVARDYLAKRLARGEAVVLALTTRGQSRRASCGVAP